MKTILMLKLMLNTIYRKETSIHHFNHFSIIYKYFLYFYSILAEMTL